MRLNDLIAAVGSYATVAMPAALRTWFDSRLMDRIRFELDRDLQLHFDDFVGHLR